MFRHNSKYQYFFIFWYYEYRLTYCSYLLSWRRGLLTSEKKRQMKTETIVLVSAIFLTGLMAGIFFTWSNTVKPGIGKLSDLEYLRALQSMNRVILNYVFIVVFLGAIVTVALVPVFYSHLYPKNIFWLFIFTLVVYWIGVFGVTVLGNIPLNETLDKTNLESISLKEMKDLRRSIEIKWNNLNLIRSICSAITFLTLVVSFLFLDK